MGGGEIHTNLEHNFSREPKRSPAPVSDKVQTAFGACLNDKKYTAAIQKDVADANTLGISGTPSFVVAKTAKGRIDGVRIVGAVPYSVFETAIKNQLNSPTVVPKRLPL